MKLASLCLLPFGLVQAVLATPVDSRITAVTVYSDRAVVTRVAEVTVDHPGALQFEFTDLPFAVIDESLQLTGQGSARATILDVSSKIAHLESASSERIKALEDEIAELKRDRLQLADREAVLAKQEAYLDKIASATARTPEKGQVGPSLDDWMKMLAFMDEQRTKLVREREDLGPRERDLDSRIEARKKTLEDLQGAGGRSAKDVVARLDASSAGTLELTLRYALGGAAWWPSYDVRLLSERRRIALAYSGVVSQATGEDWTDVALTLSTARPAQGGAAPELGPWVVDVYQAPRPKSMISGASGPKAEGEDRVGLTPFAVQAETLGGARVEREVGGVVGRGYIGLSSAAAAARAELTSATFRVAIPTTLKSDGTRQRVPIAAVELPVELEYRATPKLAEAAFLVAKAKNSTDYPLLAGPMNAFLDDAFVASGHLKTVMPGESFEFALGMDEGIGIKRRLVNRFTETSGLTSSTTRVTYEYLITITNTKKTPERVVFSEPLPVSRNEKIEVTLLTPDESDVGTVATPKEATREEGGKLVWRLEVPAGEKREIPLKFKVEYPSDLRVTGLE